jgi:hypothetical protein
MPCGVQALGFVSFKIVCANTAHSAPHVAVPRAHPHQHVVAERYIDVLCRKDSVHLFPQGVPECILRSFKWVSVGMQCPAESAEKNQLRAGSCRADQHFAKGLPISCQYTVRDGEAVAALPLRGDLAFLNFPAGVVESQIDQGQDLTMTR